MRATVETRPCRGCGAAPVAIVKTSAGTPVEVQVTCPNDCATGALIFDGPGMRLVALPLENADVERLVIEAIGRIRRQTGETARHEFILAMLPNVPQDQTVKALDDLLTAGRICEPTIGRYRLPEGGR